LNRSRLSLQIECDLDDYPTPQELYEELMKSLGWPHKDDESRKEKRQRDVALAAFLYVAELRVSEASRLTKGQFIRKEDHVFVKGIQLNKRKVGKVDCQTARLPLYGERAKFTLTGCMRINGFSHLVLNSTSTP
jgi:site-specific recombinase XerD